ncbi:DUF4250 domain-containing protein [Intestinimonas butyriciproducens]|uniref:DUF4250 domain-containing protein n=1 Tax=Candidatus Intestinimonas merdavium TaxID=2838622 RepID=A0A9D1Z6D8_9FIRM|nr:DUF4250 domain-containing protein [Intestinimonas butyriciproducens]MBM6977521.1 DUF4250 domain-containing protein [Intestinimonas butyriciproducens]HIY74296.1 DUF4250 domain-containing protein [Candidatus Intestinimonas merdavium]
MLPQDPFMLYSVVNARLRDTYADLEAFCADHDTTPEALCAALEKAGFTYHPELNQFR